MARDHVEAKFKDGTTVWLISGSPAMTVEGTYDDGRVDVVWFDGKKAMKGIYNQASLTDKAPDSGALGVFVNV